MQLDGIGILIRKFLLGLITIAIYFSQGTLGYAETKILPIERFLDKCRGAWVGQMVGVCYGAPYEFQSNGKPITEPLHTWHPEMVRDAINQDDLYVEMTFLQALKRHGLNITFDQAGRAFAQTEYKLWHANRVGRDNVRKGIMPPFSGHPDNNPHAFDIDFQIEADLFGIISPGLPKESNRLCQIFGSIMNYGDGIYGGMFVAGMYAAAYFEDNDVLKVIQSGLACIPRESAYARCIRDVIDLYRRYPEDWLATWQAIEAAWQDDSDCQPGDPVNIDAKLNGAYVVVGLLYGKGDPFKTMEYAVRCGQDADCNASTAMGILGCMKGLSALPAEFTESLPEIQNTCFAYTSYSFSTLIPACQKMAEAVIKRAGGKIQKDRYEIPE